MITENDLTNAILDELAEMYNLEQRQPGDVDKQQVMDKLGCSDTKAASLMRKLVRDGKFTEHKVRGNGNKETVIWRKAQ